MPCRLGAPDCDHNLWDAVKETRLAQFGKREPVLCDRLAVQGFFLSSGCSTSALFIQVESKGLGTIVLAPFSRGVLPSLALLERRAVNLLPTSNSSSDLENLAPTRGLPAKSGKSSSWNRTTGRVTPNGESGNYGS